MKLKKIDFTRNVQMTPAEMKATLVSSSEIILTDCGSYYFYSKNGYKCNSSISRNTYCIDLSKPTDNGRYKMGKCSTQVYTDDNYYVHVSCFCDV